MNLPPWCSEKKINNLKILKKKVKALAVNLTLTQ